jgi:hypothetical protein
VPVLLAAVGAAQVTRAGAEDGQSKTSHARSTH